MDRTKWTKLIIAFAVVAVILIAVFARAIDGRYRSVPTVVSEKPVAAGIPDSSSSKSDSSNANSQIGKKASVATKKLSSASQSAEALALGFRLIVLSPADQKAVVLNEQGQTQVVAVGDSLAGNHYEVLQITSEKLVLKQAASGKLIWLFEDEGSKPGRVQEFSSSIGGRELAPSSISDTKGVDQ